MRRRSTRTPPQTPSSARGPSTAPRAGAATPREGCGGASSCCTTGSARRVPRDRVDLAGALQGLLPWPDAARLDELAPERLPVPSGRRVAVEYPDLDDEDGAPVLAAKLQEFFGAEESPTVADGTTPVLLHLLSPAGRPLAVTADLPSFWSGAYAQVRAESRGRYPKHPWPEDPTVAEPTALTRARARGR